MTTQVANVQNQQKRNPRPDIVVKTKAGNGKQAFATIGAGWTREDGSVYIRLYGTQIVDNGFYLFHKSEDNETEPDFE